MRPASSGAAGAARAPVPQLLAALALSLLLGLQPITTDVYLPALPLLTRELHAPMAGVQLTMSALMLAFGLAQMVWGPVADRFGRRPVLLCGLGLYTLAAVGCLLAGSIDALVAWRVLQGAALAAAVVCARAIVRDLYEPAQGAQVMALALSGLGLIALVAPLSGGLAALWWGWRGPLALVALAAVGSWAFIATRLPETLRRPNPDALRLKPLLRNWATIARHRVFLSWALLVACTYGGLFTILAASSFVYMDVLGLSAAAYGVAMALCSVAYLVGTLVCRRWIVRLGSAGTVSRGAWFTAAAGAAILAAAAADAQGLWFVLLPHALFMFAHGLHQPCGQAGMVAPFPHAAGAAAALAGLVLALAAFGIGRWLGTALDGSMRPLAWGLGAWSAATCLMAWGPVQRYTR